MRQNAALQDEAERRIIEKAKEIDPELGRHEHEKDVGMYDVDCLWFEVAGRTGEEPTLALLTAAEGERMRERLQDTPRV